VSKLFGYQFSVKFKLGRQNSAADALSHRHKDNAVVHAMSVPNFALLDDFHMEVASLPEIVAKHTKIEAGSTGLEWALLDGMVVHKGCLFLPATATAWPQVLEHAHGMGHDGVQKTLQRLRASFTPGDNRLVRDFICSCLVS
jgi:hypothetical protein